MEYLFDLQQNKMTLPLSQLYQHHSNLLQAGNWYGEELSQMRQKAKEVKKEPTKKKVTTKKVVDKKND